jgi:hypothetical protein
VRSRAPPARTEAGSEPGPRRRTRGTPEPLGEERRWGRGGQFSPAAKGQFSVAVDTADGRRPRRCQRDAGQVADPVRDPVTTQETVQPRVSRPNGSRGPDPQFSRGDFRHWPTVATTAPTVLPSRPLPLDNFSPTARCLPALQEFCPHRWLSVIPRLIAGHIPSSCEPGPRAREPRCSGDRGRGASGDVPLRP